MPAGSIKQSRYRKKGFEKNLTKPSACCRLKRGSFFLFVFSLGRLAEFSAAEGVFICYLLVFSSIFSLSLMMYRGRCFISSYILAR